MLSKIYINEEHFFWEVFETEPDDEQLEEAVKNHLEYKEEESVNE